MDIVSRARNIVGDPRREWPVVAAEPADTVGLYTGYVVILAAIPMIAQLISIVFRGIAFETAILVAVSGYVLRLIHVALLAVISSKLAPTFGGVDNLPQAFKLAAYASTAAWLGGVFMLLPWVGWLLRLAAFGYSIYLFYLGIGELTLVPPERRMGYLVVVIVAMIVAGFVVAALIGGAIGVPLMLASH